MSHAHDADDDAFNPYEAPKAVPPPPSAAGSVEEGAEYRPLGGRAAAAVAFLALSGLIALVGVGSDLAQSRMLDRAAAGIAPADEEANANDVRVLLVGLASAGLRVGGAIAFCMWGYRACLNLRALHAYDLRHAAGWAAGGFFVPILNLFRPYQVYAEAWRASEPDPTIVTASDRAHVAAPVVGWWWATWLIGNACDNVSARMGFLSDPGLATLQTATWLSLIGYILAAVCAALAIKMVRGLTRREEERLARLAEPVPPGIAWLP